MPIFSKEVTNYTKDIVSEGIEASMLATGKEDFTTGSKAERSESSSSSPLFRFRTGATNKTWHRKGGGEPGHIQVVIERTGYPNGLIVSDQVDPAQLFKLTPALKKHLDGQRIILPDASAIDDDMVNDVVLALVKCANEGIPFPETAQKKPIPMIKIHCILVLFELQEEASKLLRELWDLFATRELQVEDVLWIWGTFGARYGRDDYVAPFETEYIQMMAWQIVNLDAKQTLNDEIRELILAEKDPKDFTNMLKARADQYGLSKDLPAPSSHPGARDFTGRHAEKPEQTSITSQASTQQAAAQKLTTAERLPLQQNRLPSNVESSSRLTIPNHLHAAMAATPAAVRNPMSFLRSDNASTTEQLRSSPAPFMQPEPRKNPWGGAAAPHSVHGARMGTNELARNGVEATGSEIQDTNTATRTEVGWGFGAPKPPQPNPFPSTPQPTFNSIPNASTAPNIFSFSAPAIPTQSMPSWTPPGNTQTPQSGFNFNGSAFQQQNNDSSIQNATQQPFGSQPGSNFFTNTNNATSVNEMFGIQGATGGGLGRRLAKATGARGFRGRR